MLYKRYKKETLFIISDKSDKIYHAIKELTNHDATLFKGIGCYEEKEKTLIYSVINAESKRQVAVFAAAFVSCNKETEVVPSPNSFTDGARIALTLTDDAADTRSFFDSTALAEA